MWQGRLRRAPHRLAAAREMPKQAAQAAQAVQAAQAAQAVKQECHRGSTQAGLPPDYEARHKQDYDHPPRSRDDSKWSQDGSRLARNSPKPNGCSRLLPAARGCSRLLEAARGCSRLLWRCSLMLEAALALLGVGGGSLLA